MDIRAVCTDTPSTEEKVRLSFATLAEEFEKIKYDVILQIRGGGRKGITHPDFKNMKDSVENTLTPLNELDTTCNPTKTGSAEMVERMERQGRNSQDRVTSFVSDPRKLMRATSQAGVSVESKDGNVQSRAPRNEGRSKGEKKPLVEELVIAITQGTTGRKVGKRSEKQRNTLPVERKLKTWIKAKRKEKRRWKSAMRSAKKIATRKLWPQKEERRKAKMLGA